MSYEDDAADKIPINAKIAVHMPEIQSALKDIRDVLIDVLNGQKDVEAITPALRRWQEVRQSVNNNENVGIAVGFEGMVIGGFDLTGDPKRDAGQVNRSKKG